MGFQASTATVALATPHALATQAGLAAADAGGNALDAALAAAATLAVVYPHNCALGGDLVAAVRPAGRHPVVVNATGRAPRGLTPARAGTSMPVTGPLTVTVPGIVSGWAAVADQGARRSWSDHLEPAVRAAREGVPVARGLARSLGEQAASVERDDGLATVFAPRGQVLEVDESLTQPALADTLERLADLGPEEFYAGELAERLVAGMQALGVPISGEDLSGHRADVEDPLSCGVAGWSVHTARPNSQGFVLLRILRALELVSSDMAADVLAALFDRTSEERDRLLADPTAMSCDVEDLFDDAAVRELLASLAEPARSRVGPPRPTGDTIAVAAVDGEGNAVSLIQSLFHSFGAQLLDPDTGILLHNRGAAFSLDPASPNVLAPGKRPAHTLMPVLLQTGADVVAVGCMGGRAQPQILTQVISRVWKGDPAEVAVAAPRFVVGAMGAGQSDHTVHVEDGFAQEVRAQLARCPAPQVVHPRDSDEFGHAQVAMLREGALSAGTDPRADGASH